MHFGGNHGAGRPNSDVPRPSGLEEAPETALARLGGKAKVNEEGPQAPAVGRGSDADRSAAGRGGAWTPGGLEGVARQVTRPLRSNVSWGASDISSTYQAVEDELGHVSCCVAAGVAMCSDA